MTEKYAPSPALKDALRELTEAEELLQQRRLAVRAAVAEDLKANPDVTNAQMAEHVPYTSETIRVIAREYDVPRKRQPTVRSIKPKKRTAG
ncbi:hypothetical protein OG234_13395 [Streptomyces sp. NBC_01420]|uniref:hypothetical protein n=1 Tax=Streptomyces sp. NBC_01420 TaxID=2903858 RepID=UPI0032565803